MDIFSMGSIMYIIVTGFWPHRTSGPPQDYDEDVSYSREVEKLFRDSIFPNVDGTIGDVIRGCWTNEFTSAQAVLDALLKIK